MILRKILGHAEVVTAIAIILAASWAFVAWMTLTMSHPVVKLMMPLDASWSSTTIVAVFIMWAIMMIAMMLPSAAPMILTFDKIGGRNEQKKESRPGLFFFTGAYLLVWISYAVLATGLQWGLQRSGLLTPMITSGAEWLTSSIFIVAGLYQFTPLKHSCLSRCRAPLTFLMQEWRDGLSGAWVMGLKHGLYCVGCCWALMLLLFSGGVMNPAWIVFLTALVAFEKWPTSLNWISHAFGGILILIGVVTLV
jgi:predicted metal-binding membrane protein